MLQPAQTSSLVAWARYEPPSTGVAPLELSRPRVENLIERTVADHRVSVVSAPGGFGKTTAVAAWARRHRDRVAWLSMSSRDVDPAAATRGLIRALRRLGADTADDSDVRRLRDLAPNPADDGRTYDDVCDAVEQLNSPVTLVIDDAHYATETLHRGLLGALSDLAPAHLRIVLVGRAAVEMAMSRTLLMDDGAVLSSDVFAFDAAEMGRLVAIADTPMDAGELLTETGGWPIAARLLVFGGVRSGVSTAAGAAPLRNYIRDHILTAIPTDVREFILEVSVCPDLTPQLATALTGRLDAGILLEQCVRWGLFVDRYGAPGGPVYRWHSLFRSQVREILRSTPARLEAQHRRAAHAVDDPLAAMSHLHAAGDQRGALHVLLQRWVGLIVGSGVEEMDQTILRTLPDHAGDPRVVMIRSCVQDVLGEHAVARAQFERALTAGRAKGVLRDDDVLVQLARLFVTDARPAAAAATLAVWDALARDDDAVQHDRAAVLYLIGWSEIRHRTHPGILIDALHASSREARALGHEALAQRAGQHLAYALCWLGRLRDAGSALEDSRCEEPGSPWNRYAGGSGRTAAGFIAYWSDDLDAARVEFDGVLTQGSAPQSFGGAARMMLAFSAAQAGDASACRRAASEIQAIPREERQGVSWPAFRESAIAILEEAAGRTDRAVTIAKKYQDATNLPLVSVLLSGVLRRHGDVEGALRMLHAPRAFSEVSWLKVATLTTAALVRAKRGEPEAAHDYLENALSIAASEDIRRPFCERDPGLRRLLADHVARGTDHECFIALCLSPRRDGGPLEALSERELVVFRELQTAKSMAEIAASLHISINTLKSHQRSIYRKLGVASRKDAVRAGL